MKNLFLLCLFIPLFSFSQQYSEVVEIPDKTAENLYATAREWFALSFKSANDVLQMDDAVAGKLIGKGSTHVSESYITAGLVKVPIQIDWNVKFAISIFVKDGRYKYDITDILINVPGEILQVGSGTMTVPETEVPFENHLRQKEYYKNASDPDWLYANPVQGQKFSKSAAKNSAMVFSAMYNLTVKTEIEISNIIAILKSKMQSNEDDW